MARNEYGLRPHGPTVFNLDDSQCVRHGHYWLWLSVRLGTKRCAHCGQIKRATWEQIHSELRRRESQ